MLMCFERAFFTDPADDSDPHSPAVQAPPAAPPAARVVERRVRTQEEAWRANTERAAAGPVGDGAV